MKVKARVIQGRERQKNAPQPETGAGTHTAATTFPSISFGSLELLASSLTLGISCLEVNKAPLVPAVWWWFLWLPVSVEVPWSLQCLNAHIFRVLVPAQ